MCQALQWAFINCCFIYFPQQIYQVNIYSFYQLGGIEKHRNQEMNACFYPKNKRVQHKKVLYDSNRKCAHSVTTDRKTPSTWFGKAIYLCFTLYTFTYFFSTFTFREQIPETYCSTCKKVSAESLQRFKISVLTVSVP